MATRRISARPNSRAPIAYRRAFVRLARNLVSPAVVGLARHKAPASRVADEVAAFHPHAMSPAWRLFVREMSQAYGLDLRQGAKGARTRKADRPRLVLPDDALSITVPLSDRSREWIAGQAGRLCVELSRDQHEMVRQIVQGAYAAGARPEEIADRLKMVVGLTSRQAVAVENFRSRLEDEGVAGEDVERRTQRYADSQLAWRTENIARTESHSAVEAGRRNEWLDAQDAGELPRDQKRVWISAPASDRLCDACEAMDGDEVGLDEQFDSEELGISVDAPPLHPSCVPGDSLVSSCGRVAAVSDRQYRGDLVVVVTAGGQRLACTPNHPVLSDRGWTAAGLLHVGDNVVCNPSDNRMPFVDQYDQDMPAPIEQVARAARKQSLMLGAPVPVAPEDFHGDGKGSEVAIVWSDRLLRNRGESSSLQKDEQFDFVSRLSSQFPLARQGDSFSNFHRHNTPSRCCMRCGRQFHALRFRGLRHAQKHRLASGARPLPVFSQSLINPPSRQFVLFGQGLGRHSISEVANERDLVNRFPSRMLDRVVAIESQTFSGHILNLQTETGIYIAQGIVTHNCRCTVALA